MYKQTSLSKSQRNEVEGMMRDSSYAAVMGCWLGGGSTRRGQWQDKKSENYVRGGATGRFTSPIVLLNNTPTPSNTPSRIPHATAEPNVALGPPVLVSASVSLCK